MERDNKYLQFEESKIRVIQNSEKEVEWMCLNDICEVLQRRIMIESGEAMKLCPSASKIQFKMAGREYWAIKPDELPRLLRSVSKENQPIAELCKRLGRWCEELYVPEAPAPSVVDLLARNESAPIIFNYQNHFPVTFKSESGKIMVNATQMAKSFAKLPTEWLRLNATQEFREMLLKEGRSKNLEEQVITTRGINGATWICEDLALELARWLSPDFSLWCNTCTRELVARGYASSRPRTKEDLENHPVPTNIDDALELTMKLQDKIKEDKPKVKFYEKYVENRDWFKSGRIADELQISTIQLHQFLYENKIVRYERKQWAVLKQYSSLQIEIPYEWTNPVTNKTYKFGSQKRWTPYGREFILNLWKSKHPEDL